VARGPQCPTVTNIPHSPGLSMAFFEGAGLCGNTAESLSHLWGGDLPV
jgi:hypothetical protein